MGTKTGTIHIWCQLVMIAVFNSAPIIFMTKLGVIEAALDLFERIDIPSFVYSEIRRKPDASMKKNQNL
jgi:hypothetical protein